MAMSLAQSQLIPTQPGAEKVPSLAALGQGNDPLIDPATGLPIVPLQPNAQGALPGYNWNNDQTAVGSPAWRLQNDPGWSRPDGGGR